jgi:threonine dehydratase
LGCARALEIADAKGTIYLPEHASKAKVQALSNYTADLKFHGNDSLATELHAKKVAELENRVWVSPYNDPQIMAGQGTIGLELTQQLPHFDYAFITVGGGGLIGGIGTYLKAHRPNTKIIGCQPENSPEMALSVKAGHIVYLDEYKETLSDGSAGGIEDGSITFPVCQQVVDDYLLATEEEIAEGLKFVVHKHHKIIEGAAAVTVATLVKNKERFEGKTVVLLMCGANIDIEKLKKII